MFCPNCGADNSIEQKFCRACGLNLEKSAESLIEQMLSANSENLLRHEKTLARFGNFALGGFGIVGLISAVALLYYLAQKLIVSGTNFYAGILLVSFFVFALLSLVFVFFNETLKEKKAEINHLPIDQLTAAKNTGKLPGDKHFELTASVVENSTELLYAENKTRKFR